MTTLAPVCRAQSVHLTAPTRGLIRRGALLLEDALHTASLPAGNRLLLIRHLDVGHIHPRCSPSTLALTIEQRLQQITPVAATTPAAITAKIVYFEDGIAPYILLCEQLARGRQPGGWFWSLAVPEWHPHQPPPVTYRKILRHLAQQSQGAIAVGHLLYHLQQQQGLTPVLSALTPQDAATLLTCCRLPQPETDFLAKKPVISTAGEPPAPIPMPQLLSTREKARWHPVLRHWLQVWGAEDVRSHWLSTMILMHTNPARLLSPNLTAAVQAIIQQILTAPSVWSSITEPTRAQSTPIAQYPRSLSHPEQQSPGKTTTPAALSAPAQPQPGLNSPTQASATRGTITPSSPTQDPDWYFTPYGGFFFTVSLLQRLGLPQFLTHNPDLIERYFSDHLLLSLAQYLALPNNDPIYLTFAVPETLDPLLSKTIYPWLRLMRRWCRCYLKMGLQELVTRPGEFTITPTHLDFRFDLNHSDIRIRQTGLDLNPGWVPWLGKVITFHYYGGSTHVL